MADSSIAKLQKALKSVGINKSTSEISSAASKVNKSSGSSSSNKTPNLNTNTMELGDFASSLNNMGIATPNYSPSTGLNAAGYNILAAALPPTNVQAVTPIPDTSIPGLPVYNPNVYDATAANMGMGVGTDVAMAEVNRLKEERAQAELNLNKEAPSLWQRILDTAPDRTEVRNDILKQSGIDQTEYFADQKKRITEIDSLTQDYNATVAARDAQIAQTTDKLASMNFINNQTAQINRNAAPLLNQKASNINSKAATMQALQGNFSEALKFANLAVEDAVATYSDKVEAFKTTYNIWSDQLERIDSKYKEAYDAASKIADREYEAAKADKDFVKELMLKNPNAGINIATDTAESATRKYTAAGGSIQDIVNMNEVNNSGNNSSPFTDVMQAAINQGATPQEAARAAATVSENSGIQVDQKTLNNWTNEAKKMVKQVVAAPVETNMKTTINNVSKLERANQNATQAREAVGSFFSNLFGN